MNLKVLLTAGWLAATACLTASAAEAPTYEAHEWGTFTSIQGSDGKPIRWNPFTESDLPRFVHTRQRPARGPEIEHGLKQLALLGLKESSHWFQRMETPVIYFHTKTPLRLTANVRFPGGLITEWYPAASAFGPSPAIPGVMPSSESSFATWQDLEILPRDAAQPASIPRESGRSHYYAARAAQSNPVRTTQGLGTTGAGRGEAEQFVFYRGVGDFETPVHVSNPAGKIVILNTGNEPLTQVFLWEAKGDWANLQSIDSLAPGAARTFPGTAQATAANRPGLTREFKYRLQTALVAGGLNPDEASSMVQTWADSWFDEDGTRVLYIVPRRCIDNVLPLSLKPAPAQLVRVFVGRAELIPAAVEDKAWELAGRHFKDGDRAAARELGKLLVPRFIDSLIARVQSRALQLAESDLVPQASPQARHKQVQEAYGNVYNQIAGLRKAAGLR